MRRKLEAVSHSGAHEGDGVTLLGGGGAGGQQLVLSKLPDCSALRVLQCVSNKHIVGLVQTCSRAKLKCSNIFCSLKTVARVCVCVKQVVQSKLALSKESATV